MPIPKTRIELIEQLDESYGKLRTTVGQLKPSDGQLICVDDWTVKDLLAVRAWWSKMVSQWIALGKRKEPFELPARGFRWHETPRLNADIIRRAQDESLSDVVKELDSAYRKIRQTVDSLSDQELTEVGYFDWAGKWPISRWISINTVRQYVTARKYLRKALSDRCEP